MILAGFAGGIRPLVENGHGAVHTLASRRGEACLVGRQRLNAVDEAIAKVFTEFEPGSVDDVAVLVGHLRVTFGVNALGGPVIDDAVGLQNAALIEELNRSRSSYRVLVLVVDQLVGVDDKFVRRLDRRSR